MKEKKSFEKWIGVLSISIIAIVAIVFVTVTSNKGLSKGTYGYTQCNCDAYPGYSLVDGKTCVKYNEDSETCIIDANEDTCAALLASGYKCTAISGGASYARYSCSKSTQDTKPADCVEVCKGYYTSSATCQSGTHSVCTVAKTDNGTSCYQGSSNCVTGYYYSNGACVVDSASIPACYVIDGKYTWTTGGGTSTNKPQSECTGCVAGYKESGSVCVRDCGKHATATENGCVCDNGYFMEGTQCVKKTNYCDSGVPGDCDGKVGNPDWNCTEEGMGPGGMVYRCTYVGTESVTAKVTLVYNNGNTTVKTCVINAGEDTCTISVTGNWGAKNCVNGISSFIMSRTSLNRTYYECCCVDCGDSTITPEKSATTKPTGGTQPTAAKPTGSTQPTTAKPTGSTQPTTAKPTTAKPTTKAPTGSAKPTTKKPTTVPPSEPVNPQTGATSVIFAWVIGLFAIGYSLWYFKRTSSNQ